MKQFWCDIETTGLDPEKNGIWQIAYCILGDGKDLPTTTIHTNKFDRDEIDDKALEVGGITKEAIAGFESPIKVYHELTVELSKQVSKYNKLDKMQFLGYNAYFDMQFLRKFFEKCGDKYFGSWFWFPPIDVMILAAHYIGEDRSKLVNFKQDTVARYLGIEVDSTKTHDAAYDIELTQKIYQKICGGKESDPR